MARMINVTCWHCKEDITIEPYFSNVSIYHTDGIDGPVVHTARTVANAICPYCGERIAEVCETPIYHSDIIDLAIRRCKRDR